MAQSVERILGKDEVISSILISSSKNAPRMRSVFCFVFESCFKFDGEKRSTHNLYSQLDSYSLTE